MVFKLMLSAQKRWTRLRGNNRVAEVIRGVNFKNGIAQQTEEIRSAA